MLSNRIGAKNFTQLLPIIPIQVGEKIIARNLNRLFPVIDRHRVPGKAVKVFRPDC
jgi:hypothetical protein